MKFNIGFIGLGHMGLPMAMNLLKSNITNALYVFDINQEPVQKLCSSGALAAKTVIDMANNCNVIFTMLQSGIQVKSVCLGSEGIFNHAKKDLIYIDSSSIDVNSSRELHQEAKQYNIRMVDAPVSGGVKGAIAATLTIMVGGSQDNFKLAEPILNHLGKNIIHAGKEGTGQVAKICNNMILGISMIAVCEAFNLGRNLGLEPAKLFDIVSKGSGQCWSLTKYCPYPGIMPDVPSSNDYNPGFTASMMLKDLKLSQDAASASHTQTHMGNLALNLYQQFVDAKMDQKDFSAIINFLNKSN